MYDFEPESDADSLFNRVQRLRYPYEVTLSYYVAWRSVELKDWMIEQFASLGENTEGQDLFAWANTKMWQAITLHSTDHLSVIWRVRRYSKEDVLSFRFRDANEAMMFKLRFG